MCTLHEEPPTTVRSLCKRVSTTVLWAESNGDVRVAVSPPLAPLCRRAYAVSRIRDNIRLQFDLWFQHLCKSIRCDESTCAIHVAILRRSCHYRGKKHPFLLNIQWITASHVGPPTIYSQIFFQAVMYNCCMGWMQWWYPRSYRKNSHISWIHDDLAPPMWSLQRQSDLRLGSYVQLLYALNAMVISAWAYLDW